MKMTKAQIKGKSRDELKKICNNEKITFDEDATKNQLKDKIYIYFGIEKKEKGEHSEKTKVIIEEKKIVFDMDHATLKQVFEKFESYRLLEKESLNKHNYDVPNLINIYSDEINDANSTLEINEKDDYKIELNFNIGNNPILVANNDNKFIGYFEPKFKMLENGKYEYFLLAKADHFNTNAMIKNYNHTLILINEKYAENLRNNEFDKISLERIKCQIKKEKCSIEEENPLFIDFGTSNTTVGSYIDGKTEIVNHIDYTESKYNTKRFVPTLVYVDAIIDEKPKFSFGYKARKNIIESNYIPVNSFFPEIKRWISNLDTAEHLKVAEGEYIDDYSRKDIIKEYLHYILKTAKHHFKRSFKKLYFTAPTKLLEKYTTLFKELLPNYEVIDDVIDEGLAVIYYYIDGRISSLSENSDESRYPEEDKEKIIILDIGGGTTDMEECTFSISKKNNNEFELEAESKYKNGDSNFGGNNITFRILQYLKIKIAHTLSENIECDINKLFESNRTILELIDNKKDVYREFKEEYDKAEQIIPTKFNVSNAYSSDKTQKIKENYYLLWELAEATKKEYYNGQKDVRMINLNGKDEKEKQIYKSSIKIDKLNIINNDQIEEQNIGEIFTSYEDIERLIYGDIYALLNKIINISDNSNVKFKLSGQTCNITLFAELLKEFIPGKRLRGTDDTPDREKDELKLKCLQGCINYYRDLNKGKLKGMNNKKSEFLYKIFNQRNDKPEQILTDKENLDNTIIGFYESAGETTFIIKDKQDKEINTHRYIFNKNKGKKIDKIELIKKLSLNKVFFDSESVRARLSDIENGRNIIILNPTNDNFSAKIFEIFKSDDGNYFFRNEVTINFEKDLSELSFFNGLN